MTTDEQYCTVNEAANSLGVSVATVWRWIDSGLLRAYRVGARSIRVRRGDLSSVVRPVKRERAPVGPEREGSSEQTDEVMERISRRRERLLAERGGIPFPSSVDAIREAREERTERL